MSILIYAKLKLAILSLLTSIIGIAVAFDKAGPILVLLLLNSLFQLFEIFKMEIRYARTPQKRHKKR